MFDLYDIESYDEVPDDIAIIEGELILNDNGEPVRLIDLTNLFKCLINFVNRNGVVINPTREVLKNFYHRFTKDGKNKLKKNNIITEDEIINKNEFTEVFYNRDKNMKDYNFSSAQNLLINHLSDKDKNKLKEIIIKHFNSGEKKYRLQQDIFDNNIFIDNYLFTDLCYCNYLKDEQDIIYEYFTAFENIKSESEINKMLDNEYFNKYPELKENIKTSLIK